jgi:hypothetical protein
MAKLKKVSRIGGGLLLEERPETPIIIHLDDFARIMFNHCDITVPCMSVLGIDALSLDFACRIE